MRIDYLCDRPALAPTLAAAHVEAFGALLPGWTEAEALADLRTHTQRDAIPTTLVALDDDGTWLGSVSLLQNDDSRIREYSPWLASLYVTPAARERGIGAAMIARCIETARTLDVATLYLYCIDALVPFYRQRGWRVQARTALGGASVCVMAIDIAAHAANTVEASLSDIRSPA